MYTQLLVSAGLNFTTTTTKKKPKLFQAGQADDNRSKENNYLVFGVLIVSSYCGHYSDTEMVIISKRNMSHCGSSSLRILYITTTTITGKIEPASLRNRSLTRSVLASQYIVNTQTLVGTILMICLSCHIH